MVDRREGFPSWRVEAFPRHAPFFSQVGRSVLLSLFCLYPRPTPPPLSLCACNIEVYICVGPLFFFIVSVCLPLHVRLRLSLSLSISPSPPPPPHLGLLPLRALPPPFPPPLRSICLCVFLCLCLSFSPHLPLLRFFFCVFLPGGFAGGVFKRFHHQGWRAATHKADLSLISNSSCFERVVPLMCSHARMLALYGYSGTVNIWTITSPGLAPGCPSSNPDYPGYYPCPPGFNAGCKFPR